MANEFYYEQEEILKRAREDNHDGDEREEKIRLHSYAVSGAVGALLCMIVVLLEEVVFARSADTIWIVYLGMQFIKCFFDARKLKEKTDIVLSVLWGLSFVLKIVTYIFEILG